MDQQQPGQPAGGAQPQYSPDGRWWWDGRQWVAVQQQAPVPGGPGGPGGPGPKRPTRWPWFVGGAIALAVLIGVCSVAVSPRTSPSTKTADTGAAATSQTDAATPTPATATPPPTAPPAPRVLLDLSGSGIKNSVEFDAPDHWKLAYNFDCSSFGSRGNFAVYVWEGSAPVDVPVNELDAKGQSTTDVYHGGKVHLQMNSECSWHVTATTV